MARREELTDEQWTLIEPLIAELPPGEDGRGRSWRAPDIEERRSLARPSQTQDGRRLRCYERRWKIERLFACPSEFPLEVITTR